MIKRIKKRINTTKMKNSTNNNDDWSLDLNQKVVMDVKPNNLS